MNALKAKKVTLTVNNENGAQIGKRRTHVIYTHALASVNYAHHNPITGDKVLSYHTSLAHAQKEKELWTRNHPHMEIRILPVIDPRADWFKSAIVTGSKTETLLSEVPATHVLVEKSTTRRGRYCHNVTLKTHGWFASLEDAESAKATFDGKYGARAGETEIIEVPVYQNGVRVVIETETETETTETTETTATATETTATELDPLLWTLTETTDAGNDEEQLYEAHEIDERDAEITALNLQCVELLEQIRELRVKNRTLTAQVRTWQEAHSAVSDALRACNIKKRNREETIRELRVKNRTLTAQNKSLEDSARHYKEMFEHYAEMADRATERSEERKARITELEAQLAEFVSVPADMDLVERAFDQHWRHDGGACMIELTAFEAHRPRDLEIDAYTFNGALYYSDGVGAWSIALEYLLD